MSVLCTPRDCLTVGKVLALVCLLPWIFATMALCQTINDSGFCNIINQGNNNTGIYIQYCNPTGVPKVDLLDPPLLWLGIDILTAKSFMGARSPVELNEQGLILIKAQGTLFGLSGNTQYGFDAQGKLAWMSVDNQCTEVRDDYVLKTQPPDIHPSWLEWHHSPDFRLSYEKTTECSRILEVPATLKKLFGPPAKEQSIFLVGRMPSTYEICTGITDGPQSCSQAGALRSNYTEEFIGRDSLTEIGVETRVLMMHGEVKKGDYYPRVSRREMVGVVSVWGPTGRPEPNAAVYGHFRNYLQRDLP
jgi:hypothetical protein